MSNITEAELERLLQDAHSRANIYMAVPMRLYPQTETDNPVRNEMYRIVDRLYRYDSNAGRLPELTSQLASWRLCSSFWRKYRKELWQEALKLYPIMLAVRRLGIFDLELLYADSSHWRLLARLCKAYPDYLLPLRQAVFQYDSGYAHYLRYIDATDNEMRNYLITNGGIIQLHHYLKLGLPQDDLEVRELLGNFLRPGYCRIEMSFVLQKIKRSSILNQAIEASDDDFIWCQYFRERVGTAVSYTRADKARVLGSKDLEIFKHYLRDVPDDAEVYAALQDVSPACGYNLMLEHQATIRREFGKESNVVYYN